jgi:predicted nucleic acid-binding protein
LSRSFGSREKSWTASENRSGSDDLPIQARVCVTDDRPVIVVDASVIVKWYLPELYSEDALALLDRYQVVTVDTVVAQIGSVLWKRIKPGEMRAQEGRDIMRNLVNLPIRFCPASVLAANAIEFSSYTARTFNESLFFVLALREKTRLVTADFNWYTMLSNGKLKRYIGFVNRLDFP